MDGQCESVTDKFKRAMKKMCTEKPNVEDNISNALMVAQVSQYCSQC